jgi:hypothetical protein
MDDRPASESLRGVYRRDLAQVPLPEVLVTVHRYRVPGVIDCLRDGETKRIFIDNGNIIFATSTNLSESLGDRLLKRGLITQEAYDESVRRLSGSGKRQGAILVEMGVIEPKTLFVSVREQVEEIVWSIFEWESGTVAFEPGRERHLEFIKLAIPIPRAVMSGVRRIPEARALVARMGTRTTMFGRSEEPVPDRLDLTADEARLLELADGRISLFELTKTPPLSPGENARILYGLFALRLIEVRPPKHVKVQVATRK